jgi:hypothetical protein
MRSGCVLSLLHLATTRARCPQQTVSMLPSSSMHCSQTSAAVVDAGGWQGWDGTNDTAGGGGGAGGYEGKHNRHQLVWAAVVSCMSQEHTQLCITPAADGV